MRVRRTNRQVMDSIIAAVAKVVARKGISNVTLRDVAKEAKMDIKVVQRRFPTDGDLMELYAGRLDDFITACFSHSDHLPVEVYYLEAVRNFMDRIDDYPEMKELILWELTEKTPQSKTSSQNRDDILANLVKKDLPHAVEGSVEDRLRTLILLSVAGIIYLMLLGEQSSFFGTEFFTQKGREKVLDSFSSLLTDYAKMTKGKRS